MTGDGTEPGSGRRFRVKPSALLGVVAAVWNHPANRGRRVAATAHFGWSEIRARIGQPTVLTPIGSHSTIRAHHHRGGSWRAVRANPPDYLEMTAWRRWLRPGDLFVDVGAHAGIYTLWAIDAGASTIAVEPVAELVDQLRDNLALNGYDSEVITGALGAREGTMQLAGPDLLRGHLVLDGDGEAGGEVVSVTTLDAVLGGRAARGVKIDVEGAERLVLEGGERALAEHRIELLQLEWNDCSEQLLGEDRTPVARLLERHGYELVRPDAAGRFVTVEDVGFGPDMFARPRAGAGPG
jgi:FkbM family methyltransferase